GGCLGEVTLLHSHLAAWNRESEDVAGRSACPICHCTCEPPHVGREERHVADDIGDWRQLTGEAARLRKRDHVPEGFALLRAEWDAHPLSDADPPPQLFGDGVVEEVVELWQGRVEQHVRDGTIAWGFALEA